MKPEEITAQLITQAACIQQLIAGCTKDEFLWKPDEESWSILEVMLHLLYEERHDFRRLLDHMLHQPDQPWPARVPYPEPDEATPLQILWEAFAEERAASVAWLEKLERGINWSREIRMPWDDFLTPGDMLTSWAAHDLLHIRQLVELRYALTARASQPHSVAYAGKW
jgi:hypothetical protein